MSLLSGDPSMFSRSESMIRINLLRAGITKTMRLSTFDTVASLRMQLIESNRAYYPSPNFGLFFFSPLAGADDAGTGPAGTPGPAGASGPAGCDTPLRPSGSSQSLSSLPGGGPARLLEEAGFLDDRVALLDYEFPAGTTLYLVPMTRTPPKIPGFHAAPVTMPDIPRFDIQSMESYRPPGASSAERSLLKANSRDKRVLLMQLIRKGEPSLNNIRRLLRNGLDPNFLESSLGGDARPAPPRACFDAFGDEVEDIDEALQYDDHSPLSMAAMLDAVDLIRLLVLEGGAHVDFANLRRHTALHLAVRANRPQSLAVLLHLGASPDGLGLTPSALSEAEIARTGHVLRTPLYDACYHGSRRACVLLLLRNGATLDIADAFFNPLSIVAPSPGGGSSGQPSAYPRRSELSLSCAHGDYETSQLLVNYGARIRSRDAVLGQTPLHFAVSALLGKLRQSPVPLILPASAVAASASSASSRSSTFARPPGTGTGADADAAPAPAPAPAQPHQQPLNAIPNISGYLSIIKLLLFDVDMSDFVDCQCADDVASLYPDPGPAPGDGPATTVAPGCTECQTTGQLDITGFAGAGPGAGPGAPSCRAMLAAFFQELNLVLPTPPRAPTGQEAQPTLWSRVDITQTLACLGAELSALVSLSAPGDTSTIDHLALFLLEQEVSRSGLKGRVYSLAALVPPVRRLFQLVLMYDWLLARHLLSHIRPYDPEQEGALPSSSALPLGAGGRDQDFSDQLLTMRRCVAAGPMPPPAAARLLDPSLHLGRAPAAAPPAGASSSLVAGAGGTTTPTTPLMPGRGHLHSSSSGGGGPPSGARLGSDYPQPPSSAASSSSSSSSSSAAAGAGGSFGEALSMSIRPLSLEQSERLRRTGGGGPGQPVHYLQRPVHVPPPPPIGFRGICP
ncbi:hypothetical protein H696_01375 [Fonticula alba]|uniref:Uncharacterized protein n=1 Tax=Fonticula alba TaxID=691883 RepID=A0A058ZDF8_FONAL|nr:hypothetical protein H696_01375 [Fonticula alba]KCV71966.1 hypothetical protein H696_01375 [Fonticula alba]|eukprot:XP_009493544.1 hypothetical protein H696_01375 [Fonticula alba]